LDRNDVVESVRAAADLRAVISDYMPLKKSGAKFRGLCPFHQEKTPSFYVDADKQLFYCFGCQQGGDVFKFLMLYEKLEFPEALKLLAGRYGIPIPEKGGGPGRSERQAVIGINRKALGWYREQLKGPAGETARRYLENRGISGDTIERFQVGFAPPGWTGLKAQLSGVQESLILTAGLLARKEETGRTYDRFRERVMFPILNLSDEVIGFGGRIIGEGEPKYLNSPETPAFSKGENLFAVAFAKEAIRRDGYAILVEGYMDAIALHQAGIAPVVATLGTGFTTGHVRLLKRFTERVLVNFDPDAAGRTATRRSLEVLLEHGFEVQVVALPQGKDPDAFVREFGPEQYRARLAASLPYIEFLARDVAGRMDVSRTADKVRALNEVLPFLARMDNPVRRAGQVEMIASVLRIEDRLVLQELKSAVRDRRRLIGPGLEKAIGGGGEASSAAEASLLRALMDAAEVRQTLLGELTEEDLEGSWLVEVVGAIRGLMGAGEEITYPRLGERVNGRTRDLMTRIASEPHPPASLEEGRGCLSALRAGRLRREMTDIQKRLESGIQTAGGAADTDTLLRRKVDLKRRIEALQQGV